MNHVMLDLETLGTSAGCAILSIGAVRFEPTDPKSVEPSYVGSRFYEVIELQSCLDAGLRVDANTLYWWMNQSEQARTALVENGKHLFQVLQSFSRWFDGSKWLWSHGANFDVPVLEAAYLRCKLPMPWEFRNVRDTRTLFSLVGEKVIKGPNVHHAIVDAEAQAEAVCRAVQKLSNADFSPGYGMMAGF